MAMIRRLLQIPIYLHALARAQKQPAHQIKARTMQSRPLQTRHRSVDSFARRHGHGQTSRYCVVINIDNEYSHKQLHYT